MGTDVLALSLGGELYEGTKTLALKESNVLRPRRSSFGISWAESKFLLTEVGDDIEDKIGE